MYKYILFDFDGTLVDTNEVIVLALHSTAHRYLGRNLSQVELNKIYGKPLIEQMSDLAEAVPESVRQDNAHFQQEMVQYYKACYKTHQESLIKVFPGIDDMLANLHQMDCKLGIVSSKGREGLNYALKRFHMETLFDVSICAYDVEKSKPDPEPVMKALDMLNGNTDEALLVGDSFYDILCGKNSGVKTVLVDWIILPKEELMKLQPDYCIKTPAELLNIVGKGYI